MDAADQEDNDLHPDFRLLLNNSKGPSSQALPSRDAKSSQGPEAALNDQYDAFFQILGEDRRAAERTYSRAVYEPSRGLFRVTLNKGTHFVSMGHTLRGQIYLFPEEALYLVDRGSLLVEHHGSELTVQQMWNIYLTIPLCHSGQIKENGQDNTMVMNRYLAYAYLKRLGFTVIRPGTYNIESESRKYSPTAAQNQLISRSIGANDQLPTVGELGGMMEGQPDPVLQATLSVPLTSQPEKGRKKKNIEWPKVLFAVVDGGQVSFVALSNIKAIP
ncbi:tRNA splicing endonuclease 54 [Entomortierella beljakovae]|nr:tRNA splicing endonuclease 54 [Entomortierella beljakovae]